MRNTICVLVFLFSISSKVKSFDIRDCSYDAQNFHTEYICGGAFGTEYELRTSDRLYCNNYGPGIDRSKVLKLTFRGCKNDGFVLYRFDTVRTFNVSYCGLTNLKENMFKANKYLEQFIASHNNLIEIPGQFFSYTPELNTVDLSHNQIGRLSTFTFDSTIQS